MTVYGDITPRTAAYAVDKMLERAQPSLNMAKFAVVTAVPKGKTKVVKWRRYGRLAPTTTPLTEGVTPVQGNITSTDVSANLEQYGQRVQITDVIADTHEDPVLSELSASLGETAGQTQELILYNTIKAGTQVLYANGVARNTVNTTMTANVARRAIRQLKAQDARALTTVLNATDGVGTLPIRRATCASCTPTWRWTCRTPRSSQPATRASRTMAPSSRCARTRSARSRTSASSRPRCTRRWSTPAMPR